ncbi:MAG: 50S ribosomal protein L20 [Microgenomates group bacterium]
MRVKTGTVRHKKHKKVLERTKGFWMTRHRLYKVAHEANLHAGQYAYIGRKLRKRQFRRLWITRINAALKEFNLSYSKFINLLKKAKIALNRKILAEIAFNEPSTFKSLVEKITLDKNKEKN